MALSSENGGAWITERELVIQGHSSAALKRGRESGKLRYTPLGADSYAYRTGDLQEWLEAENGTAKSRSFVRQGSSTKQPTARSSTPGGAKAEWDRQVRLLIDQGVPIAEAPGMVAAAHPALRERLVAEANQNR